MFGIIQKMDRFSNNVMSDEEKISFLQEIIDNGMIFDMHHKYQNAALSLIERGKLSCAVVRRFKNYDAVAAAYQQHCPDVVPRQDVRVSTKKIKIMIFFIDIQKDKRYTKNMIEVKDKTKIIAISGVVYTIGLALFWMSQLQGFHKKSKKIKKKLFLLLTFPETSVIIRA